MVLITNNTRGNRSDSLDSQSSTICVRAESSGKDVYADIGATVDDLASALHRFCIVSSTDPRCKADGINAEALKFDIAKQLNPLTAKEKTIQKVLASIVVMDDDRQERQNVRRVLETYNGKLIDVGERILGALCSAAPPKFAARVGDFNDNLFYQMQEVGRDIRSIISHNNVIISETSGETELLLDQQISELEDSLRSALGDENVTYTGSFMQTEETIYQPAHVDYDWQVLRERRGELFIAFFPLTPEGAFVQLWNDESEQGEMPTVHGTVVFIPYGKIFIVPSDTVHGGGFKRGVGGNLRFHLYLAVGGADLPKHQTNKYTEEHDRRRELADRFLDSPCLDMLLGEFFDTC